MELSAALSYLGDKKNSVLATAKSDGRRLHPTRAYGMLPGGA